MERITKVRAWIFLSLVFLVLGLYAYRLFRVQIIETNGNTDNTTTFTTMTRVKAARGDILDRNGNILVGNRASYDLVFNHYVIISSKNTNESLYKLVKKCQELGVEYADHFPMTKSRPFEYTIDEYPDAWRRYFQSFLSEDWMDLDSDISASLLIQELRESYKIPEEWSEEDSRAVIGLRYELDLRNVTNLPTFVFIEDVSDEALSALLELNTPGLGVESSTVREYHTKYAAHILGSMGAMTESQWAEYKEKGYAMDAYVGQSGFEQAFEEELHAIDGTRIDKVDKNGTIISREYAVGKEPIAGNNVETTIDIDIQRVSEDALAKIMKYLTDPEQNTEVGQYVGHDAEGAAVIVMEVKTGDVLACASYPTYDLANFTEKYDEIMEADFAPMFNRALQAAYPPGSTYKMVTLTAAMNNGLINLDTKIKDEGVFTRYENFYPKCLLYSSVYATHGEIECKYALEVSCNYFFYELGYLLTIEQLDETAKNFGLGELTGVELPEIKAQECKGLSAQWFHGDRILTAIGQSENRFTPMQLCVYACTLANRGVRYKATFLNRIVSPDYRTLIRENQPKIESQFEICQDAYLGYMGGMRQVVTGANGTARKYFDGHADSYYDYNGLWPYDDIVVYAKTGTAETFKNVSDNGSFICFAGYEGQDPEIAVAIYGEKVAHGSTMAKVAEEIIRAYFAKGKDSDVPCYENQLS